MTKTQESAISKRSFLQSIGMVGGTAALMTALNGWEMGIASTMTEPPKMTMDGNGKKLLILGGGLAGMVTAIEMRKRGFDCTIIEARDQTGGRCMTARKGTVIQDEAGETQVCNFENNQYLNVGPWRIPAEHYSTLHYCKTLGVELEPFANKAAQAYYLTENGDSALKGKPLKQIHVDTDRTGHITELLSKCINKGALDDELTKEDQEKILEYMRTTGLLDRREFNYRANIARGWEKYPSVGEDYGELSQPYSVADLFGAKAGTRYEFADHPPLMFQAKGGMDQIAAGMRRALPDDIFLMNSEITDIMQGDEDVTVTYMNTKSGEVNTAKGDYCISCLPFPLLNKINTDFSKEVTDGLRAPSASPVVKVGHQMSYRFWEKEELIYGGVSMTDIPGHEVTGYPNSEFFSDKGGVLLTAYPKFGEAAKFGNLSVAERSEFGLMVGEKLHPGKFRKYYNGESVSMAWHKQKYALGGWVMWSRRKRDRHIPTLVKGEKRVLFAGGGMAPMHPGWMAAAIESAWLAMENLDKRMAKA